MVLPDVEVTVTDAVTVAVLVIEGVIVAVT
jgi:hypothetical protein